MDNAWRIAASGNTTAIIRRDGSLWTFGENTYNQLGREDIVDTGYNRITPAGQYTSIPGQVMLDEAVSQVSISGRHMTVLGFSGQVYTWGSDSSVTSTTPVKVQQKTQYLCDTCGTAYTVAELGGACADETCKGTVIADELLDEIFSIAAGNTAEWVMDTNTGKNKGVVTDGHNVAIKKDGTVWAWGTNGSYQLGVPVSYTHLTLPTILLV